MNKIYNKIEMDLIDDNLSDISGLSDISDSSQISDIALEEIEEIEKNLNDDKNIEEEHQEEEEVEEEQEDIEEGIEEELLKMNEMEEININNIRKFVEENLIEYNFIERGDESIFTELKKDTNLIIIGTSDAGYQRVKFVRYDEDKKIVTVRSKRLYCDIEIEDEYVFCYKNDKMGQRQAMELLLKAIENGEIIVNKVEKGDKKVCLKEKERDKRLNNILNNREGKELKINMDGDKESRKVFIEYASNIGEKQLLLEINE